MIGIINGSARLDASVLGMIVHGCSLCMMDYHYIIIIAITVIMIVINIFVIYTIDIISIIILSIISVIFVYLFTGSNDQQDALSAKMVAAATPCEMMMT